MMSREDAFLLGDGATIGRGCLLQNGSGLVYYVGRVVRGVFTILGESNDSWDDAIKNMRFVKLYVPREKIVYA